MRAVINAVEAPPLRPVPPGWALDLLGQTPDQYLSACRESALACHGGGRFVMLSGRVPAAIDLGSRALADAVAGVYRTLADESARAGRHAVRVWNFVPDIHGPLDGADRYQAFNAGRFAAFCDWFGNPETFGGALPTASAVGVRASDLSIHVLTADAPGCPVENPRQRPAYRYSRRYGARPPCFSRATRLDTTLLIGGTASILGQESEHEDDLEAQVRETFRNLFSLIEAAAARPVRDPARSIRNLRVYIRESHHAVHVRRLLGEIVPEVAAIELAQAHLCRRELLVEIEGMANLPPLPSR